ncbi:plasmid partitioning protein RepB [Mangrovicoccus sp. HB161399]|uniref:plasmid partitioning protein RepB n=1 Tax=Mangrovicoccus sp. HB161399 TaxID=2720392 RepID=UPI00155811CB|nr:plasmid partitioning protein RepB [Mangrovicoccus sp. HB161399]
MTDQKKRRMSMLDGLAKAGTAAPPPSSMMGANRALRSARDAVDSHHVWELDPAAITDTRIADRLDPEDVADLREAIETNGQAVPILVRRHPSEPERYLLVYGRRRLEAIRSSDKVQKVRALVANLDEGAALKSQISENMARRDLSFIEKALFAQSLVESGFGTQAKVAEVLTVTKSAISMGIAVAESVGRDLAAAIGPAHGIGRPRWEALAQGIDASGIDRERLIGIAADVHDRAAVAVFDENAPGQAEDPSVLAFNAVMKAVGTPPARPRAAPAAKAGARPLSVDGTRIGSLRRSAKGVSIDLGGGAFADWVEAEAPGLIRELHARWKAHGGD